MQRIFPLPPEDISSMLNREMKQRIITHFWTSPAPLILFGGEMLQPLIILVPSSAPPPTAPHPSHAGDPRPKAALQVRPHKGTFCTDTSAQQLALVYTYTDTSSFARYQAATWLTWRNVCSLPLLAWITPILSWAFRHTCTTQAAKLQRFAVAGRIKGQMV